MSSSIVSRVRLGAAFASVVAALLAATGTSVVAAMFLDRFDERRLTDAAVVLAGELDEGESPGTLDVIVADELHEMQHTGIVFAMFDAAGAVRMAGDTSVSFPGGAGCAIASLLRSAELPRSMGRGRATSRPSRRAVRMGESHRRCYRGRPELDGQWVAGPLVDRPADRAA